MAEEGKRLVQQAVDMQGSKAGGKTEDDGVATLIRPDKEMRYASLHHHSTYSYLDGFALPRSHIRRAAELGIPSIALTEHGNVSSHAKLAKAAAEFGIHPVYGCELYCGAVDTENRTQRKNHLTILAQDQAGYQNLLEVVSQGWSDYYYEPTVSGEVLAEHRKGLVVLSGCTGSLLATSLVGGKNVPVEDASFERGKEVARRFKRTFGDNYFLEVQTFPELENVRRINVMLERISRELKIPLVATGDCHYTKPEESELQIVLHSVGRAKSLEDLARGWGYDVPLAPPLSEELLMSRLLGTGLSAAAAKEAMLNSVRIANSCQVTLPTMEAVRFPLPEGKTRDEVWREWLREGWDYRKIDQRPDRAKYVEQVRTELAIMEAMDFIDYFLITSDLVKFAKDSGIPVGPARGSAAASLVCYLLRITEVDPIKFPQLILRRFIDPERKDMPDIDLDFDDERRAEVFEYAAQKYGRDKVGRIGTFTYYKSKNSLDDIAHVHHIPKGAVESVKEMLLERSSGDLRASATIEDTVEKFDEARKVFDEYPELWKATELEGNVKGMGIHAAGLVVSTRPITEVCAIYKRTDDKGNIKLDDFGNPMEVISFDKYDAEERGLLKQDILGLSTMGMIRRALSFIGMTLQDLYDLPLDDPETIKGFHDNDCIGIFQFDGWAMRSVNGSLKPENFDEIADVNALARPGPLHSNASSEYIEVKRGLKEPSISHPLLDPITKSTHGQIVYQEQILRIVQEIGGFDWTHASYIRKIISKKIGEQEFNRQKQSFVEGARSRGVDDQTIEAIWGSCITAGAYAFNAAHSYSYAMLAYWTMWLKRHHPQAFYAASLSKTPNDKANRQKFISLLRDAERHGITVLPPEPNESGINWKPCGESSIMAGLTQVPGIGEKMAPVMVEHRHKIGGVKDWKDYQAIKGIGPKKMQSVQDFCDLMDPFDINTLQDNIERVTRKIKRGELGPLPWPTHKVADVPGDRGNNTEVVWIGTVHARNLRDLLETNFGKTGEALDLSTVKRPDLLEWVIMYGEDETDQMSITVNRFNYPKYKQALWGIELDHDLILVRGYKPGYQARKALYVWDMWVIDPD